MAIPTKRARAKSRKLVAPKMKAPTKRMLPTGSKEVRAVRSDRDKTRLVERLTTSEIVLRSPAARSCSSILSNTTTVSYSE